MSIEKYSSPFIQERLREVLGELRKLEDCDEYFGINWPSERAVALTR